MLLSKLTMAQVLVSKAAILVGQKPLQKYDNGKPTGEAIGTTFTVAAQGNGLEKISVKIEGAKPLDYTDEELMTACSTLNFIFVTFTDFVGKPYVRNGTMEVSCTASSIKVIDKADIDSVTLFD